MRCVCSECARTETKQNEAVYLKYTGIGVETPFIELNSNITSV